MHQAIVFRPSDPRSEFDALADLKIASHTLPAQCWGVTLVLSVAHHFFVAGDAVEISLGIIAHEHTEQEHATFAGNEFQPTEFEYYPSPMKTFTLTLENLREAHKCISVLEDVLLQKFVNDLIAATDCTLDVNEETDDLTAELRLKESGTPLVKTTFLRDHTRSR